MKRSLLWFRVLAILLPLSFLIVPGLAFDSPDWTNHLWHIAYFGEYFRHHGSFPATYDTRQWVGITYPVFYGYLLYPLLGIMSALVGPDVALRLALLGSSVLQFALVFAVTRRFYRRDEIALAVATLVHWAIYPLTCLYHRCAFPELIATQCLTSGIAAWMLFQYGEDRNRTRWLVLAAACVTLAIGSHPITGMLGSLCVAVLFMTTVTRRQLMEHGAWMTALGILLLLAISPWLYACVRCLSLLRCANHPLIYYPEYDSPLIRFFPWPHEGASTIAPENRTPFLEAQANVPLLALALVAVLWRWRRREPWQPGQRRLLIVSLIGLAAALAFSITPWGEAVASALRIAGGLALVQMAYRLVSYVNLGALLVIWGLRPQSLAIPERRWRMAGAICLLWSLGAVGVKLVHTAYSAQVAAVPPAAGEVPREFYGLWDYVTSDFSTEIPAGSDFRREYVFDLEGATRLELPVESEHAGERTVTLAQPRWAAINVYPNSWNQVLVDGKALPMDALRSLPWWVQLDFRLVRPSHGYMMPGRAMAVRLPAGTHSIGYRFSPPAAWSIARWFSLAAVLGLLAALAALWWPVAWSRARPRLKPALIQRIP